MDKNIVANWMTCHLHKVLIHKWRSLWVQLLMGSDGNPVLMDPFDQLCGRGLMTFGYQMCGCREAGQENGCD